MIRLIYEEIKADRKQKECHVCKKEFNTVNIMQKN